MGDIADLLAVHLEVISSVSHDFAQNSPERSKEIAELRAQPIGRFRNRRAHPQIHRAEKRFAIRGEYGNLTHLAIAQDGDCLFRIGWDAMRTAEIWTRAGVDDAELERRVRIFQNSASHGVDRSVASTSDYCFISLRLARKTRRILNVLQCNKIAFRQKRA